MRFFNIDKHISVIADVKYVFNRLGHQVDHVCMSGHAPVMGLEQLTVPMLSEDNWITTAEQKRWGQFYDQYCDTLKDYDGFICCYPPLFALLYERFHKPIIVQAPIRYCHGIYHLPQHWIEYNEFLKEPRVLLCANNRFDKEYIEYFIDKEVTHIPSLCEYTDMSYAGTDPRWLYYCTRDNPRVNPSIFIRKERALKGGYRWSEVSKFRGIAHIPYQVSTMSIFEQYTACIPMMFPTPDFLYELYLVDRIAMEHYVNAKLYNKESKSPLPPINAHTHVPDPNAYARKASFMHWIKRADYYNEEWMPHLTYFDSYDEMAELTNKINTTQISNRMMAKNIDRRAKVYKLWQTILKQCEDLRLR